MSVRPKNILIADDDDRNIFALRAVLTARGFHCVTATGGNEALEILASQPVDTALLDMMMPGMDGYELLMLIRKNKAFDHIRLIAVTAQAMAGDREKCLAAGADDYVSKPVDIDILLQKINSSIFE